MPRPVLKGNACRFATTCHTSHIAHRTSLLITSPVLRYGLCPNDRRVESGKWKVRDGRIRQTSRPNQTVPCRVVVGPTPNLAISHLALAQLSLSPYWSYSPLLAASFLSSHLPRRRWLFPSCLSCASWPHLLFSSRPHRDGYPQAHDSDHGHTIMITITIMIMIMINKRSEPLSPFGRTLELGEASHPPTHLPPGSPPAK